MGLIALGIFVLTSQGQAGATLYMVNHGFATGALFLVAGFMIVRRRSQRIADYGGVQSVAPVLAGVFLVAGLAGLSLPGLSTFVSEFLVLVGTFTRYRAAAVAATIGIILAAIYILWLYQRTMTGPVRPEVQKIDRPESQGTVGGRAADRAGHRLRVLPAAAAEHHQPGRPPHAGAGPRHGPGAAAPREGDGPGQ